jgi:phosphopantothenoylcysteine decarboxylase/phosphopantothenate--cysteine ligase
VLLMAAAVADFRPAHAAATKLKKEGRDELTVAMEPTVDVLTGLAASRRPDQTVVGFAAEHGGDALEQARTKLRRKGLDAVVVNDVSRPDIGFDAEENEVTIVTAASEAAVERASKELVASAILDEIERLRSAQGQAATTENQ